MATSFESTNMQPPDRRSLLALTLAADLSDRFISDDIGRTPISDLQTAAAVPTVDALRGRVVMLAAERQLATILSAIALDGIASRILLCTPDLAVHFPAIIATAQVDAVVTDRCAATDAGAVFGAPVIRASGTLDHVNGP